MSRTSTSINELFENFDTKSFEEKHWQNMPAYQQENKSAQRQIIVSFDNDEQVAEFAKLMNQRITKKTKSLWFKARPRNNVAELFWKSEND